MDKIYEGNALDVLREFPSNYFNLTITSPPYFGKRNYGSNPVIWDGEADCDHEWLDAPKAAVRFADKRGYEVSSSGEVSKRTNFMRYKAGAFCVKCKAWLGELGLEPSIDMYIDHLFQITQEIYRVTRKDGSFYLNIGDTYYGSGNPTTKGKQSYVESQWPKDRAVSVGKELPRTCRIMIPERIALKMITEGDWILRNKIVWHKPNAMPESVKTRFTHDYEMMYLFVKSKNYYFEQQFEPFQGGERWGGECYGEEEDSKYEQEDGSYAVKSYDRRGRKNKPNPSGRNKRSVWSINTRPFKDAHFATFPEELIETPIKASCPDRICTKCGKPVLRIFKGILTDTEGWGRPTKDFHKGVNNQDSLLREGKDRAGRKLITHIEEKKCKCGAPFVAGTVLDCFAGASTVGLVAKRLGLNYVGIEVNPDFIDLSSKRLDMDLRIKRDWEV